MPFVRRWFVVLACACSAANVAAADEAPRYNQIHFQVERSRTVDNDRMQALLSVTAEDSNPARLADQVNRAMDWAIKTVKTRSRVESRSGAYQTYPVYDKEKAATLARDARTISGNAGFRSAGRVDWKTSGTSSGRRNYFPGATCKGPEAAQPRQFRRPGE